MIGILLAASLLAHQNASPDFKYRWVYTMTNMYRAEEADRLVGIIQRASKVGYNGLVFADTKLQSLSEMPDFYIKNFKKVQTAAQENHVSLIPAVMSVGYSNSFLAHDPNLIEGMPVVDAPFTVRNRLANLVPTEGQHFKNGNFEGANGDKVNGLSYQDGPGQSSFYDSTTFHNSGHSIRMENPGAVKEVGGNCRVVQQVSTTPFRQYHVSAWLKTQDFDQASNVRIIALDSKGQSLCFQDLSVKPTQDWTNVHITFNSQKAESVSVYIGVWGGNKGKMWVADTQFEETGLLNVIRRSGCPVVVKGTDGTVYKEGEDFEQIVDPHFGNIPWPGEYEIYHASPPIKIIPGSRIREGQHLLVSFYAATVTGGDQANACVSEPEWDKLAIEEVHRVNQLFQPSGFFLSHDEMRVAGWCATCQARHLTPGQVLASNVARCGQIIKQEHPGAEMFVWSDMFDPYHNAHNNYYLVNGDLKGSWLGLPPEAVIVNWNSGDAKNSLPFFDEKGFGQILAGFYDGPVESIKGWLNDAKTLKHLKGVMYTTWVGDYSKLEKFAQVAWGTGRK